MTIPQQSLALPNPQVDERIAILLRCHFVDEKILALADNLSANEIYDVIFILDAVSGLGGVDGFESIIISRQYYESMGLFCPEDAVWRCGDYGYYAARAQFPGYPYFWLIEYDVFIARDDPQSFFREIDLTAKQDFLVGHLQVAPETWPWTEYLRDRFPCIYRCLFPLSRMSSRAIDRLFQERRSFFDRNAEFYLNDAGRWPNDEVFCATVLATHGFACSDFNDLGRYYNSRTFEYRTLRHASQCRSEKGCLFHPVRWGAAFIATARDCKLPWLPLLLPLIADARTEDQATTLVVHALADSLATIGDNPSRVFASGSVLSRLLDALPPTMVLAPASKVLGHFRLADCLDQLRALASARGWAPPRILCDVALGKVAWQSSISELSNVQHHARDAEGANDGSSRSSYGFHTDQEDHPWWSVDLKHLYALDCILITNRSDGETAQRMRGFVVKASTDGSNWQICHQSPDDELLDPLAPIVFSPRLVCRLLRVELPKFGVLHFVRFEAFGERTEAN